MAPFAVALPPPYGARVPQDPDDLPTAWVVHERTGLGPAPTWFWVVTAVLAATLAAALLGLALRQEALGAETAADGTVYRSLATAMGIPAARLLSTVAAGLTVLATAHAVRALTHSSAAGLTAAGLLLLDPAFLVYGHLALPEAWLLAAATGSLTLAVADHPLAPWAIVPVLAVGGLLEPRMLLWGVPLAVLLFLRGHIYAAPKHLATAGLQAVIVPAALVLPIHLAARMGGETAPLCPLSTRSDALGLLATDYGGGVVALHNPLTWYAGALALGGLLLGALLYGATRFRLARMPGRLQVRLPERMPRLHGRSLWLGLLVAAAPLPVLWLPLFAAALALGGRQLGRDSPWFGVLVHAAMFAFAAIYLVRFLPLVLGGGDGAGLVQDVLPWVDVVGCP